MAQPTWVREPTNAGTTAYEFDSPVIGVRLAITVATPPAYAASTDALPTIYVLDPIPLLDSVIGCANLFSMYARFPSALIVGVGYSSTERKEIWSRRTRDLTPTPTSSRPEFPVAGPHGAGGAADFLRSLSDEVMPGIAARYSVHPTDRTLIGWSFGGLFGLYALLHEPATFARYLLVSPSIWWDNAVCFAYEQEWARQHADLPARVFCAAGATEESAERHWPPDRLSTEARRTLRMVSNTQAMAERLAARDYPGLAVTCEVFAGEHHSTVFPAALSSGLRWLFAEDPPRAASA